MVTREPAAPFTIVGSTVSSTSARDVGCLSTTTAASRPATASSPPSFSRDTSGRPPLVAERGDDVRPALLVPLEVDDLLLGRFLEQLREGREAVIRLVEGGVLADHGLLHHGAPQRLLVLPHESLDGVDELLHGLGLLLRHAAQEMRLLGVADEVLVEDELVAVADEQVGRRRLHPEPDDVAVVLAQLG